MNALVLWLPACSHDIVAVVDGDTGGATDTTPAPRDTAEEPLQEADHERTGTIALDVEPVASESPPEDTDAAPDFAGTFPGTLTLGVDADWYVVAGDDYTCAADFVVDATAFQATCSIAGPILGYESLTIELSGAVYTASEWADGDASIAFVGGGGGSLDTSFRAEFDGAAWSGDVTPVSGVTPSQVFTIEGTFTTSPGA